MVDTPVTRPPSPSEPGLPFEKRSEPPWQPARPLRQTPEQPQQPPPPPPKSDGD